MMPQPNPHHAVNPAAPALLPARHKLNAKSAQDVASVIAKIKGKRQAGYVVNPDDVVAALPFGFWEVLIGGLGHSSQPQGIQLAILSAVFPHAPTTVAFSYGDAAFRQRVMNLLKRIRDVRNRIGHHDALWAMPEFNDHGALGFIPRRPRHTVNSLRQFAAKVCWFAGWIDPGIHGYIENSDHWWSLQALLHRDALVTYRQMGGRAGAYRAILDATVLPSKSAKKQGRPAPLFRRRLLSSRYLY